jgi:PITH domain
VKLKSVLIRSPPDATAPQTIKLFYPIEIDVNFSFHNREDVDFSIASDLPPTDTINIIPPTESTHHIDVAEYPVKRVNFNNVRNLTFYIENNWSDGDEEVSRLWYIGFKGEWTELKDAPLIAVYEVCFPSNGDVD